MDSHKNNLLKAYQAVEGFPSLWREAVQSCSKPLRSIETLIQQLDCVLRAPSCTLTEKYQKLSSNLEIVIRNHLSEELTSIQTTLEELSNFVNKLKSSYEAVIRIYAENIPKLQSDPGFYNGTCFSPSSSLLIESIEDMLLYYSNKLTSAKYALDAFDFTTASLNKIEGILDPEDDGFSVKAAILIKSCGP